MAADALVVAFPRSTPQPAGRVIRTGNATKVRTSFIDAKWSGPTIGDRGAAFLRKASYDSIVDSPEPMQPTRICSNQTKPAGRR